MVRIDQTIKKKELNKIENLTNSFKRAVDTNGRLHLLGLVSDGGVVSNARATNHMARADYRHDIAFAHQSPYGAYGACQ